MRDDSSCLVNNATCSLYPRASICLGNNSLRSISEALFALISAVVNALRSSWICCTRSTAASATRAASSAIAIRSGEAPCVRSKSRSFVARCNCSCRNINSNATFSSDSPSNRIRSRIASISRAAPSRLSWAAFLRAAMSFCAFVNLYSPAACSIDRTVRIASR